MGTVVAATPQQGRADNISPSNLPEDYVACGPSATASGARVTRINQSIPKSATEPLGNKSTAREGVGAARTEPSQWPAHTFGGERSWRRVPQRSNYLPTNLTRNTAFRASASNSSSAGLLHHHAT